MLDQVYDWIDELRSIHGLYSENDLGDDLGEVVERLNRIAMELLDAANRADLPYEYSRYKLFKRLFENLDVAVKFVEVDPIHVQGQILGAKNELLMLSGELR